MKKTMVIKSIRLDAQIVDKISKQCDDMSDFIRRAIEHELASSYDSAKEFRDMNKKINQIDAGSLHKSIGEIVITLSVIFEELRRQNELLKLIHRRTTFASGYSGLVLDEIKKAEKYRLDKHHEFIKTIEEELKQFKF